MKITIKGQAQVTGAKSGKTWTSRRKLTSLDGLCCEDVFSDYFHDEQRKLEEHAGVMGGQLEFKYEDGKLYATTTYECSRKLTDEEEKVLVDYTQGQWSDGIGEGFEQHEQRDAYISAWYFGQTVEVMYESK